MSCALACSTCVCVCMCACVCVCVTHRWVDALDWYGTEGWDDETDREWQVAGQPAGKVKRWGPLAFVQVYKAGHMVSYHTHTHTHTHGLTREVATCSGAGRGSVHTHTHTHARTQCMHACRF